MYWKSWCWISSSPSWCGVPTVSLVISRHAVYPRLEEGFGYFLAPVTTSGIAFQDLPEFSEGDNSKEIIGLGGLSSCPRHPPSNTSSRLSPRV